MVLVAVAFEIVTPEHAFLRPSNLVYIVGLSTVYMMLAMAETVVLLLGEIDLSVGAVALLGGVIAFKLVQQSGPDWPWWAATPAALACCCGVFGALQGTLTARLKIPSFVVTLAGFLLCSGILVVILGGANGFLTVSAAVPKRSASSITWSRGWSPPSPAGSPGGGGRGRWRGPLATRGREATPGPGGSPGRPDSNPNRPGGGGRGSCAADLHCQPVDPPSVRVEGVPWVIPIVLTVLGALTLLLQRTRFGRYVYAIGGNPEAARRAGVSLAAIRTWAFALCSAIAGLGGILLGSFFFGEYSTNTADPGQLVLYAVAAAVIGGVSLFGGRGKAIHGVLGGLLIGGIAYGVSLLNLGTLATPLEYIVPGAVLLAAVAVDVLSRRGTGSVTRV